MATNSCSGKSSEKKTFKITDLPTIENIDNDDLLIVSDHEDSSDKKWSSKSLSMEKLVSFVSDVILQNPTLSSDIQQIATEVAKEVVKDVIEDQVMTIVKKNKNVLFDLIDDVEDQTMYINAGGAEQVINAGGAS